METKSGYLAFFSGRRSWHFMLSRIKEPVLPPASSAMHELQTRNEYVPAMCTTVPNQMQDVCARRHCRPRPKTLSQCGRRAVKKSTQREVIAEATQMIHKQSPFCQSART
ncbi:hypothetical protein HBI56_026910 [Parastagonospora nodorum]|uniref:Uncharacterized protein n=1 Tax=Phaeosphaeria nodorum (strain SN15 / ATCC MYA-4574 / FGSC 10173) TaxID=321614 RepID=A0A7U2HY31_PHANO|nr:hypothetical protein HBH56_014560 [Parastagonospora nodorum]QRC94948.1 hypothetical protein JI435_406570 [Parastagonospora nodorum SN15]KAH3936981.1 hypothetical protein HBH54_019880 [Parastagonospora nodorum]KAH3953397.1 hypothetical protein HBH53_032280 [Parastagonospora nodorum]KAH3969413.1 hypothetical protein HBH51_124450 [Parastagonospora nodorum]